MNILNIDRKILLTFRRLLITSQRQIAELLLEQQELGLRKKSENWMIFLSNLVHNSNVGSVEINKNPGGYKYIEVEFLDNGKAIRAICHLQYLKKRTLFPKSAIYRDIKRKNNPTLQLEFTESSFCNAQNEVYLLFCFGEDEEGLFVFFRQPDGLLSCYYAESQNCMNVFDSDSIPDVDVVTEELDNSAFDVNPRVMHVLINDENKS